MYKKGPDLLSGSYLSLPLIFDAEFPCFRVQRKK